jgi:hypothetical protein
MAELIAVLKKALWFTEEDSLMIDSTVFQLHNKVTIIVFVASSILVFTKQFFGSPIRCDAGYVSKQNIINIRNTGGIVKLKFNNDSNTSIKSSIFLMM